MGNEPCPICRTPGSKRSSTFTPYLTRKQVYDVYRCPECRHVWCVGDTSDELLHRIYSTSFHQSSQQLAEAQTQASRGLSPIVRNAVWRAHWLKDMGLSGKLLDIGAGNGYFVKEAATVGFAAEGIDLSTDAGARAALIGATVWTGDFLKTNFPNQYDLVTMWDVLCGFPDPHKAVQRVRELLSPDGAFVFTVAEGSSRMARWSGKFWPLLIPPVNLHFFSPESIELLLNQQGMVLDRYQRQGKWLSVRFLWQKALRSLRLSPLERATAGLIPLQWRVRLNLRDIATVVARPVSE